MRGKMEVKYPTMRRSSSMPKPTSSCMSWDRVTPVISMASPDLLGRSSTQRRVAVKRRCSSCFLSTSRYPRGRVMNRVSPCSPRRRMKKPVRSFSPLSLRNTRMRASRP